MYFSLWRLICKTTSFFNHASSEDECGRVEQIILHFDRTDIIMQLLLIKFCTIMNSSVWHKWPHCHRRRSQSCYCSCAAQTPSRSGCLKLFPKCRHPRFIPCSGPHQFIKFTQHQSVAVYITYASQQSSRIACSKLVHALRRYCRRRPWTNSVLTSEWWTQMSYQGPSCSYDDGVWCVIGENTRMKYAVAKLTAQAKFHLTQTLMPLFCKVKSKNTSIINNDICGSAGKQPFLETFLL